MRKKVINIRGDGSLIVLRLKGWVTQLILFAGDGSLKIPGSCAKIHRPVPRVIYGHSLIFKVEQWGYYHRGRNNRVYTIINFVV